MSTISPSSYQAVCSTPHDTRKSPAAATTASSVNRRGLVTPVEDREGDEGEEPWDVEIEPVRQHELESDQDGGGQRSELQDRLAPRQERDEHGACDQEHLQHLLDDMEVGHTFRVILAPAPGRERRLTIELEAERTLGEHTRGVQRVWLKQQDQECGDCCARERE